MCGGAFNMLMCCLSLNYHLPFTKRIWGFVRHCVQRSENISSQLSMVKKAKGMWVIIRKDVQRKQTTLLSCCINPTCASDLHTEWGFVHSVSENIMGATKGWEKGIWEPLYGSMLFKKSLNRTGNKTSERAVMSSTFMNKSESRETVDAGSHN